MGRYLIGFLFLAVVAAILSSVCCIEDWKHLFDDEDEQEDDW